jgi:hypothetical protein
MKYYVIRHPSGAFYSDNDVVGHEDRIEADVVGNKTVHTRALIGPVFKAFEPNAALKYGTEKDATDHLTHPDLGDAKAFAGCTVLEVNV